MLLNEEEKTTMEAHNTCPACQKDIPPERCFGNTMACECGWTKDLSPETKGGYKLNATSIMLIGVGVCLILSFIHIVNWNTYAINIIPLKTRQILGFAKTPELNRIVNICTERKKWSCVEETLTHIYQQDSTQIEALHKLGKLYVNLGRHETAIETYKKYFDKGGDHTEAHYQYAKSLGKTGKVQESIFQYQKVLGSRPNVLQTTVTRSYVAMLIANKQWQEAKSVIENYRRKSKSGEFFMENELKKINEKLI